MKKGIVFGYDGDGIPRSCSIFGPDVKTSKTEAMGFCAEGCVQVKIFERASEDAAAEMKRWQDAM